MDGLTLMVGVTDIVSEMVGEREGEVDGDMDSVGVGDSVTRHSCPSSTYKLALAGPANHGTLPSAE